MVNLGCKLAEEIYKLCEKDQGKCMSIYDIIFDLIRDHINLKEKVLEFIIASKLRFKFYTHLIMFVDSKTASTIIDSLKILIGMLKLGKESYNYPAFHKEVVTLLNDLTRIIKELFTLSMAGSMLSDVIVCQANLFRLRWY